jgi:hypothetical protein
VQRVRPAVEPAWEAWSDGEVLMRMGDALGFVGWDEGWDVRATSRELSMTVRAFAGITIDSVGEGGRPLAGPAGDPA